jgi:wyosine [tRNA(Phe)-imidazoG37] synthetase (radical SAM superfamily)
LKEFTFRQHDFFGRYLELNPLGEEKICGFDCVYCSLGPSSMKISERKKTNKLPEVEQLASVFGKHLGASLREPDQSFKNLIISGNGEPTLFPEFPALVSALLQKRKELMGNLSSSLPIVCLTNGETLFANSTVAALNKLDQTYLKLDFGSETAFKQFNRPKTRTTLEKILHGAKGVNNLSIQTTVLSGVASILQPPSRLDEWLEVVAMLKPQNLVLILGQTPFRGTVQPVAGLEAATEEDLHRLSHWLERRLKIRARVDSSSAA